MKRNKNKTRFLINLFIYIYLFPCWFILFVYFFFSFSFDITLGGILGHFLRSVIVRPCYRPSSLFRHSLRCICNICKSKVSFVNTYKNSHYQHKTRLQMATQESTDHFHLLLNGHTSRVSSTESKHYTDLCIVINVSTGNTGR